jgi:hypothetical protein
MSAAIRNGVGATAALVALSLASSNHVNANDAQHNAADDLTANLAGTDEAHFIAAEVQANGSYSLSNSRNGTTRTYASH